jgi:hypothetical protein
MQRKKTNKTSMFPDTKKNLHKNQTQIRRQRPMIENLRQKPMAELIKDGIKVRNKLKLYHDTMNKKHSSAPFSKSSIPLTQVVDFEKDISVYHPDFPINRDKPITTYSTFKPNVYQDQPFNKHHFKGWGENTHIPKQVEPLDLHIKPTTDHTVINIMQSFVEQAENPYLNVSLFQKREGLARPGAFSDMNVPDFLSPITHNNKENDMLIYELQNGFKNIKTDNIFRINQVLEEVQKNPGGALNQVLNKIIDKNQSTKILDMIKEQSLKLQGVDEAKIWKFSDLMNPSTGLKALVTMKLIENLVNNKYDMNSIIQSASYLMGGNYINWSGVFAPEMRYFERNLGGITQALGDVARTYLPNDVINFGSQAWRGISNIVNPFGAY